MRKFNKAILKAVFAAMFLSLAFQPSFARRVKTFSPSRKDYYIALRNLLSKYLTFTQTRNFMEGFSANLRIFDRNSSQIQEICKVIRKAIFNLENAHVSIPLIHYFLSSILPQFQSELYNYTEPEVYEEVLNILINSSIKLYGNKHSPEGIFYKIISNNCSRDDDVGAFFAQMFQSLYVDDSNFEQEFYKLQKIISGISYKPHTKWQILRKAAEEIMESPDKMAPYSVQVELLIAGSQQDDLFVKTYSISTLALLCSLDGLSSDTRRYIFNSALNGIKSIHWNIYFDRNSEEIPQEVNYLAVLIDYLAEAEEACREYGINVDLAADREFLDIYKLLLLRGFDFEKAKYYFNKN